MCGSGMTPGNTVLCCVLIVYGWTEQHTTGYSTIQHRTQESRAVRSKQSLFCGTAQGSKNFPIMGWLLCIFGTTMLQAEFVCENNTGSTQCPVCVLWMPT